MSDSNGDQLDALVRRPVEGIAVELKTWIDPRGPDGIAKLVKSAFALRNRDGGYLVIGFDDKTRLPDPYSFSDPVEAVFHADVVQGALSRYASQPFAVEVHLRERDGQTHPVIAVPPGVRIPAVVKADLGGEGGKSLLKIGDLFFRTLRANNTPSSARILPADYPELMELCFNNREADIGGFLRRQLGQADLHALAEMLRAVLGARDTAPPAPGLQDRVSGVIAEGASEFAQAVERRGLSDRGRAAADGLTMEVGLVLDPEKPDESPTQSFLNLLAGANPQYTGWPVWLDSRGFAEERHWPVVAGRAWQALIISLDRGWSRHLDFMRLDPRGAFYLRRAMQDDLNEERVAPRTSLDAFLVLIRVAEVLAVGLSFARAAGWDSNNAAGFGFRWSALEGRHLNSWANPMQRMAVGGRSAAQCAESFVSLPADTPHAALAPYVSRAVRPLFSVFDGYEPPSAIVEEAVKQLVERRLT